jgi:hypothetical protein
VLASSILAWQVRHSVSGLITPYVRIDSFDATGSHGLNRTIELATASTRARTKEGWREPVLVGVAIAGAIVTDGQRRDEILAGLTELDVDGFYVILEARGSEEGYLRACREFGETLRGHGRVAVLAYAGPELVPLLAGGSWDVAVTGTAQSNRRADFKGQGGGNAGVPRRRLLAHKLLQELEEAPLFDVAERAAGLLRCGCSACRRLFPAGRPFSYEPTAAAHHYLASLQTWVQDVRDQAPERRASWIRGLFDATRREAREIDLRLPAGSRLGGVAHLRDWQDWLI